MIEGAKSAIQTLGLLTANDKLPTVIFIFCVRLIMVITRAYQARHVSSILIARSTHERGTNEKINLYDLCF